jgi:putative membrane protein
VVNTEVIMQEAPIASAKFDKKVKQYWLVFWVILPFITLFLIPLIPIIVILVFIISQRLLDAMSAELLARKLVVKRGVFFKVEKSIPLEKITDVGMTQGPLMRLFGIYRLDFETAGQSGPGALVSMLGIINAADFREQILAQKDKLQGHLSKAEPIQENSDMSELVASVKRIEGLLINVLAKNT